MSDSKNQQLADIFNAFQKALTPSLKSEPGIIDAGGWVEITYDAGDEWQARVFGYPNTSSDFGMEVRIFHAESCPVWSKLEGQERVYQSYKDPMIAANVWMVATRMIEESLPLPVKFTSEHLGPQPQSVLPEKGAFFIAKPQEDGSLPSCEKALDGQLFWKEGDALDLLKELSEGNVIYECTVTTTRALPAADKIG